MLSQMPQSMRPIQTVVLGAEVTANHSIVTLEEMELHYYWEQCGEEVNATERDDLNDDMKELCEGIPIIRITTVTITKETFEALAKEDEIEASGESAEPTPSNRAVIIKARCSGCYGTNMNRNLELTLMHNMYVHVPCSY